MPTVSIIIPIYNAERYLQECLESIRVQSYKDFEVILVDDGSTDSSASICKAFAESDNRFLYFYKENGGVSSARNAGLEKASGDWIAFIDADDWVSPHYLQTLLEYSPMADITFFGEKTMSDNEETGKTVLSDRYCTDRQSIEDTIYELKYGKHGDVFGWTWDKVFGADIIRKHNIRFSEKVSFREDEIFTLEYCRYVKSIRTISDVLYFYRVTSDGLTKKGLQKTDLLPSSLLLEESMDYYTTPALKEHILKSVTDYRAMDIYASPMSQLADKLRDYQSLVERHPQPGIECKVNHLTQYLKKSFWLGYLYCLIRKI